MKFWQAVVVAQMAAGAVWADRFRGEYLHHLAADIGNILIGAFLWWAFWTLFDKRSTASPAKEG